MTDEKLLRAIGAARDDDAPRAVYADLLVQRGDPRGDFIHLQLAAAKKKLTAERRKRHDALLKEHEQRWLGPLKGLLGKHRFERGFLSEVLIAPRNARRLDPKALEWLTVERASYATPEMGPQFQRLREAMVQSLDLLEGTFPELVKLEVLDAAPATPWRKRFASTAFPTLRHLGFRGSPALISALLDSSLGQQLTSLTEFESTGRLVKYAKAVMGSQLTRFSLASATLLRKQRGWELELRAPRANESLELDVLKDLEPDGLERLTLTGTWSAMHREWAHETIAKSPLKKLFERASG